VGVPNFYILLFGVMYLDWSNFVMDPMFLKSFIMSPLLMQRSCPGLSLVTSGGFMVVTLSQSSSPPNGKVRTHRNQKQQVRCRAKPKACPSIFLDMKVIGHKEFALAGLTVSSDVLQ
jgi:hypothetical protein